MKVLLAALVFMLAVIGYGQAAREREEKGGKIRFKVLGKSGKMAFLKPGRFVVVIQFDEMKERNRNNTEVGKRGRNKHSFRSFATQDFAFSPVKKREYNGLKTKAFNFTAKIAGTGATLNVEVFIFLESGDFINGNETLPVSNGTVKFNIELKDWEFCNGSSNCASGEQGEFVDLTITLISKSKPQKRGNRPPPRNGKKRQEEFDIGDGGRFSLSSQVDVDGGTREMPQGYPKHESRGGKEYFTFRFPKFNNRAFYDPSITLEDGSSGALRHGASVLVFLGALIANILANF